MVWLVVGRGFCPVSHCGCCAGAAVLRCLGSVLSESSLFRALALSALPSALFLFGGIMSRSVLLILSATLFAPAHILISYQNAKRGQNKESNEYGFR